MVNQEVGRPEWDDGADAAAAAAEFEEWDNSFGGLGSDIALEQPVQPPQDQAALDGKAKAELLIIDLTAKPEKVPSSQTTRRGSCRECRTCVLMHLFLTHQ